MAKLKILFVLIIVNISELRSYDISKNVFGDDRDGLPAAFGDFNSDGLTDIFITRDNGTTLDILFANEKGEPMMRSKEGTKCKFVNFKITSVVPGDFDGDAFMDIMITTQDVSNKTIKSTQEDIRIIWGGVDRLNCSIGDVPIVTKTIGHPLAIDYNQDMIIDLFGIDENQIRSFWVFSNNRSIFKKITMSEISYHTVKIPHSHSFLDINGDYTADLLITTPIVFEIWLGNVNTPGFDYYKNYNLPIGSGFVGQSLFLDVELSGQLYLLIPFCYDKECLNSTILLNDDSDWVNLKIDFEDKDHNVWGFNPPNDDLYTETMTMRGGDYNMDGYPDLLVTLRHTVNGELQTFLLENVPCTSSPCNFKRTYNVLWNAFGTFQKGTFLSVFYDFFQDGILDFIVLQKNLTTNKYKIGAYKNNLDYDANFIKVMVLTGLTNKIVPTTIGPLGKRKGTYGTNLPGPRIFYHTLSQEGLDRSGVCAQLPQSAYYSLNLPYSIFGLDRTPNFVDTLQVGLSNYSKVWTQLIPNSQIVVIPWPPNDPSRWKVQLFVTPAKVILKSVWVFTGICGGILMIVIFFHMKEKRDDRLERKREIENTVNT